jgi:hypothetical protein
MYRSHVPPVQGSKTLVIVNFSWRKNDLPCVCHPLRRALLFWSRDSACFGLSDSEFRTM